jgi:homogentisate 1,2-dioxygenase
MNYSPQNQERLKLSIHNYPFSIRNMPHYYTLGTIPHKRHTQFRKPDGNLYAEQLFSTEGFSNDYSLLYHHYPPTQIIRTDPPVNVQPVVAEEKMLQHRSFRRI